MGSDQSKTKVVVVGGGPGGYPAAFHAADLGLDVVLIDTDANPGGVCLYRGCIPSKALLHVAGIVEEARHAADFGVAFDKPTIDLDQLNKWKESVIAKLTGGLGQLAKQRKARFVQGRATFASSSEISVKTADNQEERVPFDYAVIATGSRPTSIPTFPQCPAVMDSTGALALETIPDSLLVVGGGYIGLELGQAYSALGSRVSVVEMLPSLLATVDADLRKGLERRLEDQFESVMLKTRVTQVEETHAGIQVSMESESGETRVEIYERLLVSVGRQANTENLGLENTSVQVGEDGFIQIDEQRRTDDPAIFAIGDVAGQPMLAHKATREGHVAAEAIAGMKTAFDNRAIPAVVFTHPEIAWCGLTEAEAKDQGVKVEVSRFPWAASGRATTLGTAEGVTKLVVEPETERLLGMGISGPGAGELIAEGVLAIEMGAVVSDLGLTIHPHPTLSETVMEAAEVFFDHSPHFAPRKKRR